jgi:O-antigen/teichoic acid export membrane protein
MLLAVAFAKAGLSNAIIRFYNNYKKTARRTVIFSSTVLLWGLFLSIVTLSLYLSILPWLLDVLTINQGFKVCFWVMAAYLFVRPLNIIVLNFLRVTGKTIFLNVLNFLGKIFFIIVSLALLLLFHKLYWYFIGSSLSEIIISLVLFWWFFKNYQVDSKYFSKKLAIKMVKFGFPLLLTEVSFLLLSYADRYMILAYKGERVLGLYSVGYNLAMYIADIITFSITYAIVPLFVEVYEESGKRETEALLAKIMHYLMIAVIPIVAGYFAVTGELITVLASLKYQEAAAFSPIILVGTFFLGFNNVFNAGLYLKRKSTTILFIMLVAVMVNIGLNMFLIPRFSAYGAAMATLISCMVSSLLTITMSFKHILVRFHFQKLVLHVALAAIMFALVEMINVGPAWGSLLLKISVGIVIVVSGNFFLEKELFVMLLQKLRSFR